MNAESRYRALFEALDEGVCTVEVLFDEAGRAADYRFLEVNPAFEGQTGIRNAVGRSMREIAPDHEAHWFEVYGEVALTGVPRRFEHEAAALGRVYDVYAVRVGDPGAHQVSMVFRDVSTRRRAQAEVQALTATLEARVADRTQQLVDLNSELLARTRALEAFSRLTRGLSLETDRVTLVRRAQEVVQGLLPVGFAAYYEPEGPVWRMKTQVGDPGNAALQALMDAGMPIDSPSFAHPFRTGRPEYQEAYVPGTDTAPELTEHVHSTAALPLRLGGDPVGLFGVVQFESRTWSRADRAVLETVVQHLSLALERAEAVRRLAEEREALAAFMQFTELAAGTTEAGILAQHAAGVLHTALNIQSAVYFELEDDLWKAQFTSGALPTPLERALRAGVPARAPTFDGPHRQRTPMFFEPWDAAADGLQAAGHYRAVARYPVYPAGRPAGLLGMATTERATWTDREKAVFTAVGDSFRLALERAAMLEQVERQRERLADLNAEVGQVITRTARALEAPARWLEHLQASGQPTDPPQEGEPPQVEPAALRDEIVRLRQMSVDLRELAHMEERPLTVDLIPLGELFAEMQNEWQASPRTPSVMWLVEALPIVRGDRALLKRALEILMTFTQSETRGAQYLTVRSWEVEGEVHVAVEDDGTGLTGEEAATLFDLAVRTDQDVPVMAGTLIQVRRILARHGGWAWAEAGQSTGRVILAFPRDPAVTDLEALFRTKRLGE
jgi:GAF domain-containing protein